MFYKSVLEFLLASPSALLPGAALQVTPSFPHCCSCYRCFAQLFPKHRPTSFAYSPKFSRHRVWGWEVDIMQTWKFKLGYSSSLFRESVTHTHTQQSSYWPSLSLLCCWDQCGCHWSEYTWTNPSTPAADIQASSVLGVLSWGGSGVYLRRGKMPTGASS